MKNIYLALTIFTFLIILVVRHSDGRRSRYDFWQRKAKSLLILMPIRDPNGNQNDFGLDAHPAGRQNLFYGYSFVRKPIRRFRCCA